MIGYTCLPITVLYENLIESLRAVKKTKAENFLDVLSYENCERHVLNWKYC